MVSHLFVGNLQGKYIIPGFLRLLRKGFRPSRALFLFGRPTKAPWGWMFGEDSDMGCAEFDDPTV